MNFQRFTYMEPKSALKPYVHTFVRVETGAGLLATGQTIKLYPMDYAIMCIDPALRHFDEYGSDIRYRFPIAFLGVSDRLRRYTDCSPSVLQVIFKPHGAYRLFGIPQDELARTVTDLEQILRLPAHLLRVLMDGAASDEVRRCALEGWLLRLATEKDKTMDMKTAYVVHACQRIGKTDGVIAISEIRRELGMSETGFRQSFKTVVGIAPKAFAETVRFNRIHRELRHSGRVDWQDIAYRYGFYDQNHFIKGFKRFLGCCPTDWLGDAEGGDLTAAIRRGISRS